MKNALVIGASGGIGAALSAGLEGQGYAVTGLSRMQQGLDVTSAESVDQHLGALDGPFTRIVVATGILAPDELGPEKSLDAVTPEAMARVLAVNAIGPALILRHVPRLLPRDEPSVAAVITARVGSIGDNQMGGWYSYRASKAAANQIVRCAAIEVGRKRRDAAVVALHPGTVATEFTANYPGHKKVAPEEAVRNLLQVMDGLTPEQTGRFYDYAGQEILW